MEETGFVKGRKILVVEDEKNIRDVLYEFLTTEGYSVTMADDGMKALIKLRESTYDLMLTDILMPNLGGRELIDRVRQRNLKIPALIMTALPLKNMEELENKGVFACIPKPFRLQYLSNMIQKALNHAQGAIAVQKEESWSAEGSQ